MMHSSLSHPYISATFIHWKQCIIVHDFPTQVLWQYLVAKIHNIDDICVHRSSWVKCLLWSTSEGIVHLNRSVCLCSHSLQHNRLSNSVCWWINFWCTISSVGNLSNYFCYNWFVDYCLWYTLLLKHDVNHLNLCRICSLWHNRNSNTRGYILKFDVNVLFMILTSSI